MGDEKDISKVLLRDRYAIIEKKRDIDKFVDRFQVYFVVWIVFSYKLLSYRISRSTRLLTVWDSHLFPFRVVGGGMVD